MAAEVDVLQQITQLLRDEVRRISSKCLRNETLRLPRLAGILASRPPPPPRR